MEIGAQPSIYRSVITSEGMLADHRKTKICAQARRENKF